MKNNIANKKLNQEYPDLLTPGNLTGTSTKYYISIQTSKITSGCQAAMEYELIEGE